MNISFKDKDPKAILKKIEDAMGGRQLASLVSFNLTEKELRITISKFGNSYLDFDVLAGNQGTDFKLKSEKIALAHRAFKNDVTEKIIKVIEQAGGKANA